MIRAGVQRVIITPPIGTPLGGYLARQGVSIGIHDELYATALILQGKDCTVAIVSADLIGLPADVVDTVKAAVWQSTMIPPHQVLLAATHTHSGPDLLFGHQGLASKAYCQVLSDALVGGIQAAWHSLEVAQLGVGQGWVEGIGVNRRSANGTPVDPRVVVLRVDCATKPRVALVNYTCHPVVLGPDNLFITADYPGYMVKVLEKVFGEGFVAMFTNGAAGDINTGHSAELSALGVKIPGRTFERAERLGTVLAGEVLKILESIETFEDMPIAAAAKKVLLPLKSLPPLENLEALVKEKENILNSLLRKEASPDLITKAKVEKFYADLLLKQAYERKTKGLKSVIPVELQAIRIGNCVMLAFPGELFVEIGLEIKAKSPFKYTCIVGYANGYVGYVPTRQAYEAGGYEVMATQFAPDASDVIIEESLRLLNSLT